MSVCLCVPVATSDNRPSVSAAAATALQPFLPPFCLLTASYQPISLHQSLLIWPHPEGLTKGHQPSPNSLPSQSLSSHPHSSIGGGQDNISFHLLFFVSDILLLSPLLSPSLPLLPSSDFPCHILDIVGGLFSLHSTITDAFCLSLLP